MSILDYDWLEVIDKFFVLLLNCTVSEDSNN